MQKQIIKKQEKNDVLGVAGTDFAMMTNDNRITKSVLTLLLKRYNLLIELYNKTLIAATYQDMKIIGRTPSNIILVFDEIAEKEMEVSIEDIRIIRVYK